MFNVQGVDPYQEVLQRPTWIRIHKKNRPIPQQ
jgi:hypothetical protein